MGLSKGWAGPELVFLDKRASGENLFTRMGRSGSTVPAVQTSPQKFKTCTRLEVQFLGPRHTTVRACIEDLYWVARSFILVD